MKPVNIERYNLDYVMTHDKILFNTNNHEYTKEQPSPPDYEERLRMTNTKHWIDKFHQDNYKTLTLDNKDLTWMKKALIIGSQTGRFSHIFDDELDETCKRYYNQVPPSDIGWFIRSDKVSLKEGKYGIGPYKNIKNIIESIVTTKLGHTFFNDDDTSCTIYFINWQNINPDKEFRIFVYQNEITAISAQHLYSINQWLNMLSDEEIINYVHKILDFFESDVKDKLSHLGNYTFDFAFVEPDDKPYFIEPNGFGRYYAAGSALYHWIYDHDTLHQSDVIEFRFVNEY